jgi:hypothetical protein
MSTSFGLIHSVEHKKRTLDSTAFLVSSVNNTKLFGLEIDNTGNTTDVFVKVWFAESGSPPSVGTTVPNIIRRVTAGRKMPIFFNAPDGWNGNDLLGALTKDIYLACVTTGGTAGSTSPTNAVEADIFTD